jgi:DNA-nicking Smr family endonuclease
MDEPVPDGLMPKPWKKGRKRRGDGPDTPRTLHTEPVVEELDLHGHFADEAERRLEMFLERVARTDPGGVVRVITGRGASSGSPPVLQPLVREALTGWLRALVADWAVDVGGGAYLVRLKG